MATDQQKENYEVASVNSHFLDSGSFTLWTTTAKAYATSNDPFRFYRKSNGSFTKRFRKYMDAYAAFIKNKEVAIAIDLYANVDVIPNPELTWESQKYLEKEHGLSPVPVVHYKTDLKWLERYIEEGYELIALGGLVGSAKQDACKGWIDRAFDIVCNTSDRLPCVKIHGFGVTSFELVCRYPWFCVDSTSWIKMGAYGGVLIPKKHKGDFVLNFRDPWLLKYKSPYLLKVSQDAPTKKLGQHYLSYIKSEIGKKVVEEWLEYIQVPLGLDDSGRDIGPGICTHCAYRCAANLYFFEAMRKALPPWPWPFRSQRRKGFDLFEPITSGKKYDSVSNANPSPLIIYYSGDGSHRSHPEVLLGREANIMLTFHKFYKSNKPTARFQKVIDARKADRYGKRRKTQ